MSILRLPVGRRAVALVGALALLAGPALAQPQAAPGAASVLRFGDPPADGPSPFFADQPHDPAVPTPESVLGQGLGTRLAHHAEIVALYRAWAAASPRVTVDVAGHTHEGRELLRVVITSPENHARLARIREGLLRLTDPEDLSAADADALLDELPAVAWMGYSIHGDELSGADASLALGWHLAAGQGDDVAALLDRLVIVVDPCMNPDGRERIVAQVEQLTGYVPNLDHASMQRGRWPWGRGNHYLFDMNRDWMTGTQPETRARWASARWLPPQLFVDAHEMGSLDTFLMYPQAAPHNPYLPATLGGWQGTLAADLAAAFDAHGWSYYTREWADAWAPFYSDAWGSLSGAVGMLYEQARTSGFPLRNRQGRVLTYREAVQHQLVASLANLSTAAVHRRALLADYLAHHRADLDAATPGNDRMLAVFTGRHPDRERRLLATLLGQEIEVSVLDEHLEVSAARNGLGEQRETLDLPPGTWLVPARQPYGALVKSFLSFDVRLDEASLLAERSDLLRKGTSRMYDVTAWSLPLLYDLDAWWCDAQDDVGRPLPRAIEPAGMVVGPAGLGAPVAWVVDGDDDRSVAFAAAALESGVLPVVADETFETAGRVFPRGSVVVRAGDNDAHVADRVQRAAIASGATAFASGTGRAPGEGADLGGGHFGLLSRPRVAMVSGAPVHPDTFGHLWHLLDTELRLPVSFLDASELGWADLRPYNVIVLPPGTPVDEHAQALGEWVRAGGTLVAVGGAAGALAENDAGLTEVVRRRDVLEELDGYHLAARREQAGRAVSVDAAALWGDVATAAGADASDAGTPAEGEAVAADSGANAGASSAGSERTGDVGDDGEPDDALLDPDAERQDAWARRFSPAGALCRGLVDDQAWITAGCGSELPVLVSNTTALLSREPVTAAIRLAPAARLRLSGLLWPEAAERLEDSAWLTVERQGHGQVILFADVPNFRGQFVSAGRLFANAVVYGPGLGADQPVGW